MTHPATKIVIITEKLILDRVTRVIEAAGASGYTILAAGGKGGRGTRSTGRAAVVDGFSNVKIEVIAATRDMAMTIADEIAEQFFHDYSGIIYLEGVEILRPESSDGSHATTTATLPVGALSMSIYNGQTAVLATMHGKEEAIAPALSEYLGLTISVPDGMDTDQLGTFTGEVERPGDMTDTAMRKARQGMSLTGCEIGIASEGSFGPHPVAPFVAAGIELIVFIDSRRNLAISESELFETTNFGHEVVDSTADLNDFLSRAGFPEHALIVRPNTGREQSLSIVKGIRTHDALSEAVAASVALASDGLARVETDMRAHEPYPNGGDRPSRG